MPPTPFHDLSPNIVAIAYNASQLLLALEALEMRVPPVTICRDERSQLTHSLAALYDKLDADAVTPEEREALKLVLHYSL